ncbi:PQQ-dependent sugar dehydrogenase [Aquimarina sp. D1M17]|uniref:PQQ-dependent sugar dehydrogenase n=1 Tax=Aquimarina acroporae TaxID=2937283 RepID=UPI0020BE5140|nr:PQQ-dependent sugar dehydrogenase [Aquimarina acroporae]MCK8520009.1 PQQ-dependent sugar dehydrogenase [Aquimarina acroporae]
MNKRIIKYSGLLVALVVLWHCSSDNNNDPDPDPNPDPNPTEATSTVISTLSVPWEILWGPDNFLWVAERNGRISRINPDSGAQQELININAVEQVQESGLLGMVLHPQFTNNPYVYAVYTYSGGSGLLERLVRFTYENNSLTNETTLLENIPAASIHNGSRLLITPDLHLFMTTGDAGNTSLSQNTNSLAGKILRLNLDGSIPNDNPFTGSYIYSIGHRNPQGLVLHPNGNIYSSEHGPTNDDEINKIVSGANYGWPNVMGVIDNSNEEAFASTTAVTESIFNWTPTIAPSDMVYYTGDAIPEWTNKFLMAVLKDKKVVALTLSGDGNSITEEASFLEDEFGRIRDIAISPEGRIFIATNGESYGDTSATHRIIEIHRLP